MGQELNSIGSDTSVARAPRASQIGIVAVCKAFVDDEEIVAAGVRFDVVNHCLGNAMVALRAMCTPRLFSALYTSRNEPRDRVNRRVARRVDRSNRLRTLPASLADARPPPQRL